LTRRGIAKDAVPRRVMFGGSFEKGTTARDSKVCRSHQNSGISLKGGDRHDKGDEAGIGHVLS
jgi:hypothetical protein